MAFIEQRLPDCIAFGATFGPEYQTNVVVVNSGHENRNINWAKARLVANIGYQNKTEADTQALIEFFRAVKGRAHGFRVRDWSDYKVSAGVGITVAQPLLGANAYQLCKMYEKGGLQELREIRKPVAAGLQLFDAGGLPIPEQGYTLDATTGVVSTQGYVISHPVMGMDLTSFKTLVTTSGVPYEVGDTVAFLSMAGATELEGVSTQVTAITSNGFYCNIDPTSFSAFASGYVGEPLTAAINISAIDTTSYSHMIALDGVPPAVGATVTFSGLAGATELNGQSAVVVATISLEGVHGFLVHTSYPVTDQMTPSGVISVGGTPAGNIQDVAAWGQAPLVQTATPHGLPPDLTASVYSSSIGIGGATELNGLHAALVIGASQVLVFLGSPASAYTSGGTIQLAEELSFISSIAQDAYAVGVDMAEGHGFTAGETVQFGDDFVGATELEGEYSVVAAVVGTQTVVLPVYPIVPSPYVSGGSLKGSDYNPAPVPAYWVGEFDVPVRFDVDKLELQVANRSAEGLVYSWPSIPLIELRV